MTKAHATDLHHAQGMLALHMRLHQPVASALAMSSTRECLLKLAKPGVCSCRSKAAMMQYSVGWESSLLGGLALCCQCHEATSEAEATLQQLYSCDHEHPHQQFELGTADAATIMPCSAATEAAFSVLEQPSFEHRHIWGQALTCSSAATQSQPCHLARPRQRDRSTWFDVIAMGPILLFFWRSLSLRYHQPRSSDRCQL